MPTGLRGSYTCSECRKAAQAQPDDILKIIHENAQKETDKLYGDINNYEIIKKLGEGGAGAVYLARRLSDGLTVVLKTLLAQVAVKPTAKAQFHREIEITEDWT